MTGFSQSRRGFLAGLMASAAMPVVAPAIAAKSSTDQVIAVHKPASCGRSETVTGWIERHVDMSYETVVKEAVEAHYASVREWQRYLAVEYQAAVFSAVLNVAIEVAP